MKGKFQPQKCREGRQKQKHENEKQCETHNSVVQSYQHTNHRKLDGDKAEGQARVRHSYRQIAIYRDNWNDMIRTNFRNLTGFEGWMNRRHMVNQEIILETYCFFCLAIKGIYYEIIIHETLYPQSPTVQCYDSGLCGHASLAFRPSFKA